MIRFELYSAAAWQALTGQEQLQWLYSAKMFRHLTYMIDLLQSKKFEFS